MSHTGLAVFLGALGWLFSIAGEQTRSVGSALVMIGCTLLILVTIRDGQKEAEDRFNLLYLKIDHDQVQRSDRDYTLDRKLEQAKCQD